MARSVFTLAIIGLGVVHALPTSTALGERQILGGGSGTLTPGGSGTIPTPCFSGDVPPGTDVSPCFIAPPITGGLIPPKEKRQGGFGFGGGSSSSDEEKAIAALELQLLALKSKPNLTDDDLAEIAALEALILYTEGITSISAPPGVNTSLTHGNRKRFTLPPDYNGNRNQAIDELERELEQLQNKELRTEEDITEIKIIQEALYNLVNVDSISAPPGTITTFHPGKKRRFTLPPDANTNINKAIDELEKQLEALQNKSTKSSDDRAEIEDIKAALQYLAGVTSISAPSGSISTFHPGKREISADRSQDLQFDDCSDIDTAERLLETMMLNPNPTKEDAAAIKLLKNLLYDCGITIIQLPNGASTTIKPSDKIKARGLGSEADTGFNLDRPWTVSPSKRQTDGPAIGTAACQFANLQLKDHLNTLVQVYGEPSQAPPKVFQLEQMIVKILLSCGVTTPGWSVSGGSDPVPVGTINPDPSYPGGTINPDPSYPGGTINPDPTTPGGSINPDPTEPGSPVKPSDRRAIPNVDPTELMAVLQALEKIYGA